MKLINKIKEFLTGISVLNVKESEFTIPDEEIIRESGEDAKELPEGLTSYEVNERIELGHVNVSKEKSGKSYLSIIYDNLFTFFNLIWAIVTGVLLAFGSFNNLTFLLVVIPNLLIAIIQEVRAKITVEKLSVATDPKATVVRDGALWEIDASELVLGDVIRVDIGRQVLSDSEVISGTCEVNESMLTGESNPIKKQKDDKLLAGSFLVSGSVYARIEKVGSDNYMNTLEHAAKKHKAPSSNLFRDLNKLIKTIGGFMIPMGVAVLVSNFFYYRGRFEGFELWKIIAEKSCGSIVGMIPAGVYLLVTLTLSLSVVALAKKKTLVQDMYSIEMLASADMICLDKTGTITDGTMQVVAVQSLDGTSDKEIEKIMSYVEGAEPAMNATSLALVSHFGKNVGTVLDSIAFSSSRKYSAVKIAEIGSYALGAPGFVPCEVDSETECQIAEYTKKGERVLLLVRCPDIGEDGKAVALIALSDRIRPGAKETIEKFQDQDVTVKVLSGDNAATVSSIAGKVGIKNHERYISCEHLTDSELVAAADENVIFGRVTPEQKVLLIKTFKSRGHTVAMTGDGVNDTLALKEANCAIAMADGSEVARKISQIVLLNSDFSSLPEVVREGRRCINNVRQSAVLFLMKTMFTIFVTFFSIITLSGYPFAPNNFFFLETFIIGLASVLLALEPNDKRIEGNFLDTVLVKSFPCAVSLFVPTLVVLLVGMFNSGITAACRNSVAMCVVTLVGLVNLMAICRPYTKWRAAVIALTCVLLGASVAIGTIAETLFIRNEIFGFSHVLDNPLFFGLMLVLGIAVTVLMQFFRAQLENWVKRIDLKHGLSKLDFRK